MAFKYPPEISLFHIKKWLIVVFTLFSNSCFAEALTASLHDVELQWAKTHYEQSASKQSDEYQTQLAKLDILAKDYPNNADIIYWQALLKISIAAHQNPIAALETVHEVRDLLSKAITIKPNVMNGAAYIVLGKLYDKVPPAPIAFGDDAIAKKMLETALQINTNSIANNYFYGEFLAAHDDELAAEKYLKKALSATVRAEQPYPDKQLKHKAELALAKLHVELQKAN